MGKYSLKKRKGIRKQQSFKKRKEGGFGESIFGSYSTPKEEREKIEKSLKNMGPTKERRFGFETTESQNKKDDYDRLKNLIKGKSTNNTFAELSQVIYNSSYVTPEATAAKNLISKFSSDKVKRPLFLKAKSVKVPDKKIQELTFGDLKEILIEIGNLSPKESWSNKPPQKLTKQGAVIEKYQKSRITKAETFYGKRISEESEYWRNWGEKLEELCSTNIGSKQVMGYIFNDFKKYYIYKIEDIGKKNDRNTSEYVVGVKTDIDGQGKPIQRQYTINFGPHISDDKDAINNIVLKVIQVKEENHWATFSNALENLLSIQLKKHNISKPDLLKISDTKEAAAVKEEQKLKDQGDYERKQIDMKKESDATNENRFYYKVFHLPELVGRPGFYFNSSYQQIKSYELFTNNKILDDLDHERLVNFKRLVNLLFNKNNNEASLYDQWLKQLDDTSKIFFKGFIVTLMKKILFKEKGESWTTNAITEYISKYNLSLSIESGKTLDYMKREQLQNLRTVNWKYASEDEYVKDLVGKNLFYLLVYCFINPDSLKYTSNSGEVDVNIFSHIYNKNYFTDSKVDSTDEKDTVDEFLRNLSDSDGGVASFLEEKFKAGRFTMRKQKEVEGKRKEFIGELVKKFKEFAKDATDSAKEINAKLQQPPQQPPQQSSRFFGFFGGGEDNDEGSIISSPQQPIIKSPEELQKQRAENKQQQELEAFDKDDREQIRLIDNFDSLKKYVENKAEYHIKKYELLVRYYQVVWEEVVGKKIKVGRYLSKIFKGDERIMEDLPSQKKKSMLVEKDDFKKKITLLKVIVYHLTENILLYAINSFILDCYIGDENFKNIGENKAVSGIYRKVRQMDEKDKDKAQELYGLKLTDEGKDDWQWKVFKKQAIGRIEEEDVGEGKDENYKTATNKRIKRDKDTVKNKRNIKKGGEEPKELVVLSKGRKRREGVEGVTATEEEVDRNSIFDNFDATILYRNPNMYEPVYNKKGNIVPKIRKEYENNDDYSQIGRRFYLQEFIYWLNIDFIKHVMREDKQIRMIGGQQPGVPPLFGEEETINTSNNVTPSPAPSATASPAIRFNYAAPANDPVNDNATANDPVNDNANDPVNDNAVDVPPANDPVNANAVDTVVDAFDTRPPAPPTTRPPAPPTTRPPAPPDNDGDNDDALNTMDEDPCKNIISDFSKYDENKWLEIFLGVDINKEESKIMLKYASEQAASDEALKKENELKQKEAERVKNIVGDLEEQFKSIEEEDEDMLQALDSEEEVDNSYVDDDDNDDLILGGANKKMNIDGVSHKNAEKYINDKVVYIQGPNGPITINNFLLFTYGCGGSEIREKNTKIIGWLLLDLRNLINFYYSTKNYVSRNSISGLLKKEILEPLPQTYQEKIEKLKFEINEEKIKLKTYERIFKENLKQYNEANRKGRIQDKDKAFQYITIIKSKVAAIRENIKNKKLEMNELNENKQQGGGSNYVNETAGTEGLSLLNYKRRQGNLPNNEHRVPKNVKALYIPSDVEKIYMEGRSGNYMQVYP